ncbi:MAG: hypothetical protein HFF69_09200 [Oscillospiraceae bacterium]|jgi:hypothetical protein|nr:hypothetical protein [Oscillospiraceae bacterium]
MRKPDFMPILLALLLAGLCLSNLAGCAGKDKDVSSPNTEQNEPVTTPDPEPAPSDTNPAEPAAPADGPLTEDELKYFNEEFFNGEYLNIRNQFLSSIYETAADINLFELFYCGTGEGEALSDEEWAAFEAAGGFVETDVTKVSTANADAVLMEHIGLTLAETSQSGLDSFIYLPDYDAYYLAHGDTNYLNEVVFSSGEWRDGLIHLYYADEISSVMKCVSLRETADGSYQFVSNVFFDDTVS